MLMVPLMILQKIQAAAEDAIVYCGFGDFQSAEQSIFLWCMGEKLRNLRAVIKAEPISGRNLEGYILLYTKVRLGVGQTISEFISCLLPEMTVVHAQNTPFPQSL